MKWYWILLLAIGYIIIGVVIDAIFTKFKVLEEGIDVFVIVFWPIVAPIVLFVLLCMFLYYTISDL